jgi:histidinol-phosphate aminotransferase
MRYLRETIEAMAGYTPGEQPSPESRALKLNTNENPYPPSPRVLQAIRESDWSVLRRYPDPMANKARDAIAALWGVGRDEVLCGNGSDELLAMIVRAAVEPGEAIAYPVPTYSLFPVLAEVHGARVLEVPSPEDFSVPLEALARAQAKVVFLCTPNAPTGVWTPPEAVARLADWFSGLLVVDEAYADFAPASAVPAVRGRANVLVLRTLSKSYSLAGLRFGYAVGPRDLIAGLAKVKDSYNVDGVTIEVAAAALRDQAHLTECVKKVRAERSRLSAALEDLGLRVVPSEANFLLAAVPGGDARAWYEHLKARGILVRYWDQPRLRDKLRITVGTPEEDDRLLEALRAGCKESRP